MIGLPDGLSDALRRALALPADCEAEQAEKANLDRAVYEAGERFFHEDPDAWLTCLDGPCYGEHMPPRTCDCQRACGCNTWPVRFREDDGPGEYVLAYQWCPQGAVITWKDVEA